MTYHNTTHSTGKKLGEYRAKAMTQEDKILQWFDKNYLSGWTPSEIQYFVLPDAPLTSARRGMTNLTNEGKLIKTDRQKKGRYGRPEYTWKRAMFQTEFF